MSGTVPVPERAENHLPDDELRRIIHDPHTCFDQWHRQLATELLELRDDRNARLVLNLQAAELMIKRLNLQLDEQHRALDTAQLRIAELEAAPHRAGPETSDGYHTFAELYHYRMLYNAALFNEWAAAGLYDVHKSVRHSDGSVCFDGRWFVVYAQLPTGQISNHYEIAADWYKFRVPIRNIGAEWDGHTPQDAAARLADFLTEAREAQT